MKNSLNLEVSTQAYAKLSQVYAKLLTNVVLAVALLLLLLISCQHPSFSFLSKPRSSNAFLPHLMKVSDFKSCNVGITSPILSMEMVCAWRPEIKRSILKRRIGGVYAYVSILTDKSCQH